MWVQCGCRTWRNMTTRAQQQLCNTNLASTSLRLVRYQRHHHPTIVAVPARNLAGQVARQWHTYSRSVATMARTASHYTDQQASRQSKNLSSKGLSAAEGRQMLVDSIPLESFKMTGVSFEGRQELVSRLRRDQAVMMVKEPDNPYDQSAIAVQTLSAQTLGYVPKEHTARFPHDITFGHVYSSGPASSVGLWGATVAVRPTLQPLNVDAIPANLAPHVKLSRSLAKQDWDAICLDTCNKANYRCEVSGGVGSQPRDAVSSKLPALPVNCNEVWRADPRTQTLQLRGFVALHPDLHITQPLQRQHDGKDRQQAVWRLQAMNAWTAAEAEEYLKHIEDTAQARSSQEWKFDFQWLTNNNIGIPSQLQSLCHK